MDNVISFDDYDDPPEVIRAVASPKLSVPEKMVYLNDFSTKGIEYDEVVETSTLVSGDPVDTPLYDLFVVTSNAINRYGRNDVAVDDFLLTLGDLGPVVDFGSGFRRKYCDSINVVEHVEWRSSRMKCTCGCGIVPYATPFYAHKVLKTFLAINSLQNNSYSFIQRMLAQVLMYNLDFVIIQPVLNDDEFDCSHLILSMFAGVKVQQLDMGQTAYIYQKTIVQIEMAVAGLKESETCVGIDGSPVARDSTETKQSILIIALTSQHELLVVDSGDNGPVDFLVAGHVTFGETPLETAVREWKEEMVTGVPVLHYYGMLRPPVSIGFAYVFVARLDQAVCSLDRGKVRILKSNDRCRNDFYPAIRAIDRYFKINPRFDLSHFVSLHYMTKAKAIVKKHFYDRYACSSKFRDLSEGQKWLRIKSVYHSDFNHSCRVEAADLRSRFHLDMRSTNESAIVYSKVSAGMTVVLNTDSKVPCPIVTLIRDGRRIGYCVYVRTSGDKRYYKVVECNSLIFQPSELDVTVVNYTFNLATHESEYTDTNCGAYLLARVKGISYDEAVSLIRSNMGKFVWRRK